MEFFGVRVHEHVVGQSQLELGQVQADGIKVKNASWDGLDGPGNHGYLRPIILSAAVVLIGPLTPTAIPSRFR